VRRAPKPGPIRGDRGELFDLIVRPRPPFAGGMGEVVHASHRTSRESWALVESLTVSYGPPWAHYLGGYQDRLLGGPLGLPGLRCTAPEGVEHKDCRGEVLG
jgi:hypothetical protein